MSDTDIPHVDDVLELAELYRPSWPTIRARYRAQNHPTNDGEESEGEESGESAGESDGSEADGKNVDHAAEAEKWKALARKHEKQAKANSAAAKKLQEVEDASKSETERVADKATQAEQRATTAEAKALRLEVALDNAPEGMPIKQVRKLVKRLAGSTQEELEEDAKELFADFAPATDDEDDDTDTLRRRPRARLRPGASPPDTDDDDGETDPSKLAAKVPRQFT